MDLFGEAGSGPPKESSPLADRMRPQTLSEFVGQTHLIGPKRILRKMIESGELFSMILWGPPGTGKTTLARIIARESDAFFYPISAVTAGVKDVRKVMDAALTNRRGLSKKTILFIDEIHRFNKAQQDALLHAVEDGTLCLIGATTENPGFEVIAPLLSRCRVFKLHSLSGNELAILIRRAIERDGQLGQQHIEIEEKAVDLLIHLSGGDGRIALNGLDVAAGLAEKEGGRKKIVANNIQEALQKKSLLYDKGGDYHYDTISAFIKSVRGSDPDAAVYWMARMLEAGEDPLFIARRLIVLASEDIGNADPLGLVLANAAFQAAHAVGMPEARIILSQAATYLASAPKSNAAYLAINLASEDVKNMVSPPVPLHLRNAVTKTMKEMAYGQGYLYAHDYENGFVRQEYLPDPLKDRCYYHPKSVGRERILRRRLEKWWPKRHKGKTASSEEP